MGVVNTISLLDTYRNVNIAATNNYPLLKDSGIVSETRSTTQNNNTVSISLLDACKNVNTAATNNYPLLTGKNFDDIVNEVDYINDEITIGDVIYTRNIGTTYEEIYENISSYPHVINMVSTKYVVTTYTTGETTSIVVTTDMRVKNIIKSTITGDVPSGINLVKTSIITGSKINVTYS